MTCWVWMESGECVDAATHEEGIALLQRYNPREKVEAKDVVDLDALDAHSRSMDADA